MSEKKSQLPPNPIQEFIASKQTQLLQYLQQSQFTGELWLRNHQQQAWVFYFYLGRILYATGGIHSVRRWRRNMYLYFPQIQESLGEYLAILRQKPIAVCWEYDFLLMLLSQQKLSQEQISQIIKAQVTEILFDLTQTRQINYSIETKKLDLYKVILINSEQVVVEAWKQWQQWQSAKIADRSPNLAPVIIQPEQLSLRTSPKTYQIITKLLQEKKSLRDLAVQINQDLLQLTRLFIPYIQLGLIELVEVPDLGIPYFYDTAKPNKSLIISIFHEISFSEHLAPVLQGNKFYYLNLDSGLDNLDNLTALKPDLLLIEWEKIKTADAKPANQLIKLKNSSNKPILLFVHKMNFLEELKTQSLGLKEIVRLPIQPDALTNLLNQYVN